MRTSIRCRRMPLSLALFLVAAVSTPALAGAQNPLTRNNPLDPHADQIVCPLSEKQTRNSIAAFAKMAPTFTTQKRCFNCHGGIDPFANPTNHGGGTIDKKDADNCNGCHSNLPPRNDGKQAKWELPILPDHSFVNKDATTLCKMMKRAFVRGLDFEFHILDDNGKTNFQGMAFLGTRGLPDVEPDPIRGINLGQFFNQAKDWVEAMGGEFEGDEKCGCQPLRYAIQVYYSANVRIGGVLQTIATMGPVNIPITFHDDRSFEGEGTLPFTAAGVARGGAVACQGQSQGAMTIKVYGKATEEFEDNHMHIEGTNVTPTSGVTSEQCNAPPPFNKGIYPLQGGGKATLGFDVLGRVGDSAVDRVPLPGPGVKAILRVELVDLDSEPVNPN